MAFPITIDSSPVKLEEGRQVWVAISKDEARRAALKKVIDTKLKLLLHQIEELVIKNPIQLVYLKRHRLALGVILEEEGNPENFTSLNHAIRSIYERIIQKEMNLSVFQNYKLEKINAAKNFLMHKLSQQISENLITAPEVDEFLAQDVIGKVSEEETKVAMEKSNPEAAKTMLSQHIDRVLERGEKLEDLESKVSELEAHAITFQKNRVSQRWCSKKWQQFCALMSGIWRSFTRCLCSCFCCKLR